MTAWNVSFDSRTSSRSFAVELPIDLGAGAVHPAIPGPNFLAQGLQIGDPPGTEALLGEDADFDFRLVEPASVSRC